MKTRLLHTLYLAPAVILALIWIVVGPIAIHQFGAWGTLAAAAATAAVMTWCITLFAHALRRDLK